MKTQEKSKRTKKKHTPKQKLEKVAGPKHGFLHKTNSMKRIKEVDQF